MSAAIMPEVTAEMARELAVEQKVCVRPLLRRVIDQQTGDETRVALPCGSTRESVCPSCADKARRLRIQQCAEGWHRDVEPEIDTPEPSEDPAADDLDAETGAGDLDESDARRVRSTRRRQDAAELPRVPVEDRTVGRVFETPDGRRYRPSMFVTITLPSYGKVKANGAPVDPSSYNYRRAALDALHFPKLVDRFWQNLRRCAGFKVQYFAAVEPQKRLAPHLHAAARGAIPRQTIRQVVRATYAQVWWPHFDQPVYVDRVPVWDGHDYVDPDSGVVLPTWDQAVADLDQDGRAAHVLRLGSQVDMAGIIAPSEDADRAIRYLTKYLAKSIADTYVDNDAAVVDLDYESHVDRLHQELLYLPCSERCANWLRFGVQPKNAGPGLRPGACVSKAHDRENLGIGGRRVLVSRQWSGKTLKEHRADRATVVREALLNSGIVAPEIERLAASVRLPDGRPRFVWSDSKVDHAGYVWTILQSVNERARWREQYEAAKKRQAVDTVSAIDHETADRPPPGADREGDHRVASPITSPNVVPGPWVKGERSESEGHEVPLTRGPGTRQSQVGEATPGNGTEGDHDG
ncbi:replication initiator [Microlunatus elymi]|uniref:replication initiator n=1 Tax=Microlunatus elymi TaxID=2596828 RepID=UPI001AEF7005|nr:replication initiator [Microlunatus elymi]